MRIRIHAGVHHVAVPRVEICDAGAAFAVDRDAREQARVGAVVDHLRGRPFSVRAAHRVHEVTRRTIVIRHVQPAGAVVRDVVV